MHISASASELKLDQSKAKASPSHLSKQDQVMHDLCSVLVSQHLSRPLIILIVPFMGTFLTGFADSWTPPLFAFASVNTSGGALGLDSI